MATRLPVNHRPFPALEQSLRERAALLHDMGHAKPAGTLETFADRMNRASNLYQDGQRASAYRMLHARVKPGLANPHVQEAMRLSSRAEDLSSAFGLPRGGQSSFLEAAGRMRDRAQALRQTGHAGPARTLETFARRLDGAARQAALGNRAEALSLFRQSFGEKVQGALQLSGKAEDALAAFGRRTAEGALAPTAFQGPFGQTAEKMLARAEWLKATGKADQARIVTRFANRLVKAGEVAASGDRTAALGLFRRSLTPQVQEAIRTSNRAGAVLEAFGQGSAVRGAAPAIARGGGEVIEQAVTLADTVQRVEAGGAAVRGAARVGAEVAESSVQVGRGADVAVKGAGAAVQTAEASVAGASTVARSAEATVKGASQATGNVGILGRARQFLGQAGDRIKGLFGGLGKHGNPGGWQTIRQGFSQMLPGLGKAARSSALFSAAFSTIENVVQVFRGERTTRRAMGGVLGDTASGVVGGVGSALASGAAIAGLGALGLAGLPLTLAAGAIGIGGFLIFDRFFKNSAIYDKLTHLFT